MSSSLRRLAKDHAALRQSLPPNYLFLDEDEATAVPDDLTHLSVWLTGSEGTPYSQGLWKLYLKIPSDYPKNPPKATFKTRIYHPNVEEHSGNVCLETLKRDWDPKLTLKDILITISCLLIQPNPDSALNAAAGALIQEDFDAFSRQAKLMASIHARIPKNFNNAVLEAQRRGSETKPEKPDTTHATSIHASDHTMQTKSVLDECDVSRIDKSTSECLQVTVHPVRVPPTILGKRSLTDRQSPVDQDDGASRVVAAGPRCPPKSYDKLNMQSSDENQNTHTTTKTPKAARVSTAQLALQVESDNLQHNQSTELLNLDSHQTEKENIVDVLNGRGQIEKPPRTTSSELSRPSLRKVSNNLVSQPRRGIRRL